jgi:hypothetical protein
MDIRLRKAQVFHVFGQTVNASGATIPNATLNLLYPEISDPLGNAHRSSSVDGAFQFNRLVPGTYAIQAQSGASRELKGHYRVTVSDHNIDDVVVTLVSGLEIPLSVRIEDADSQQAQKIKSTLGRFTLTASDGVNENAMAQSQDNETWLFHNIGPGTYRMGLGRPRRNLCEGNPVW